MGCFPFWGSSVQRPSAYCHNLWSVPDEGRPTVVHPYARLPPGHIRVWRVTSRGSVVHFLLAGVALRYDKFAVLHHLADVCRWGVPHRRDGHNQRNLSQLRRGTIPAQQRKLRRHWLLHCLLFWSFLRGVLCSGRLVVHQLWPGNLHNGVRFSLPKLSGRQILGRHREHILLRLAHLRGRRIPLRQRQQQQRGVPRMLERPRPDVQHQPAGRIKLHQVRARSVRERCSFALPRLQRGQVRFRLR